MLSQHLYSLRRNHGLVLTAVVVAAFCQMSFSPAAVQAKSPPNVLVLVSDDQRPDTIRAFGNDLINTPTLDRLAKNGTSFRRAITANPICTPSRAEILTGCTGFRCGVMDFGRKIDPAVSLWADTMRRANYRTCYVGKWHNDGLPTQRGYDETVGLYRGGGGKWSVQSFDWNGKPVTGYRGWLFHTNDGKMQPERGVGLTANISADFADAAISYIKRDAEQPFFLHVNFTAPHDPVLMPHGYEGMYDPAKIPVPANFLPAHPFDHGNYRGRDEQLFNWPRTKSEVQHELAAYYSVISHLDAQIGRILMSLKETGQMENTVIVFASDHGLSVGSHGLRGKQSMYEHTVGVPFILSGPGVPREATSNAQCYLRDLFPTVCDLTGVEIPPSVQGRSLKPVLDGETDAVYPFVVAYFRNFQRMIRTEEWKLVRYPKAGVSQLFHLKTDPHELHNLYDDEKHAAVVADLDQKLRAWQEENGDPLAAE